MGAKRLYYILLGTIGLSVVVLFGCVYAANNLLVRQSKQVADAQLKRLVAEQKQVNVAKAKADTERYKTLAGIANSIVPQDKDQAQAVREIVNIADASGITLGTVSFPSSTLGAVQKGSGKAATNSALSQLRVVKGIPGVYSMDITVQSDATAPADYNKFIAFLDALEHNRRTALVTTLTMQPLITDPSKVTFTLVLNEYIKP